MAPLSADAGWLAADYCRYYADDAGQMPLILSAAAEAD